MNNENDFKYMKEEENKDIGITTENNSQNQSSNQTISDSECERIVNTDVQRRWRDLDWLYFLLGFSIGGLLWVVLIYFIARSHYYRVYSNDKGELNWRLRAVNRIWYGCIITLILAAIFMMIVVSVTLMPFNG